MKAYTLEITRNGKTETVAVQPGQQAAVEVQPDTAYRLLDTDGGLVARPQVEWVGDDLWVYAGEYRGSAPDLVLKGYRTSFPVYNGRYVAQTGNTFVTAADEAAWLRAAPVAVEAGAAGVQAAPLWGAGLAAAGLSAVGMTALRRGGAKTAAERAAEPASGQPEAERPSEKAPQPQNETAQETVTDNPSTPDVTEQTETERPSEKAPQPQNETAQETAADNPSAPDVAKQPEAERPSEKAPQPQNETAQETAADNPSAPDVAKQPEAERPSEKAPQPQNETAQETAADNPSAPDVAKQPEAERPSEKVSQPQDEAAQETAADNPSAPDVAKQPEAERPSEKVSQPQNESAQETVADKPSAPDVAKQPEAEGPSEKVSQPAEEAAPRRVVVDALTADNIINAAESLGEVQVSGRVENARAGDTVEVAVGGRTYSAPLDGGVFKVSVAGAVLAADSEIRVAVKAGGAVAATAAKAYAVDTEIAVPLIRFDAVAQDDIINSAESQAEAITVSGRVENAEENDEIVLAVGEAVYRGKVAGGAFAVAVDTKTLLNHGKVSASLTTADKAQNTATGTAEHAYRVDTEHNPVIRLDRIAGDDVLNIAESQSRVTVSGSVDGVADGERVLVSCGCESCGASNWIDIWTKVKDGGFSVDFSGADLKNNGYGTVKASVVSTDEAGNTATAQTSRTYTQDLQAPEAVVSIDPVAGGDVLGRAERARPVHTVSGTVSGLGADERIDGVVVSVNGRSYDAEVADGAYRVDIPTEQLAAAERVDVRAALSDAAGNRAVAENSRSYRAAAPEPSISLNPVAADNIISKAEAQGKITLSGRAENIADGTEVVLTSGRRSTKAVVSDGLFSTDVEKTFFGINNHTRTNDGALNASAVVEGADGARVTVSAMRPYRIDLVNATTITLDAVAGENVVDAEELAQPTLTISGRVGDGRTGETVNITVNKNAYTATVGADGRYSVQVETARAFPNGAEGKYSVTASVRRIDEAGNEGSGDASVSRMVVVDKTPPVGVIVLDAVTGDNVLNRSESQAAVTVSGRVSRLGDGDDVGSVTVTVGGNAYPAVLSGSSFSALVPAEVMAAHREVSAHGVVKDSSGRTAEAAGAVQRYTLQTAPPAVEVKIDSINGGKAINAQSLFGTTAVTGTVATGAEAAGGTASVDVTVNGTTYAAALNGGNWVLELPAAVLAGREGRLNITASARAADVYGNTAEHSVSAGYEVDTAAPVPVIELNAIAAGNIIGGSEKNGTVTVSGRVGGEYREGDKVVLTVGGEEREAAVSGGAFSAEVSGALLASADVPVIHAAVSTRDDAGNGGSARTSLAYGVQSGDIRISLDDIAGDGFVNVTEAQGQIEISGSVSGADAQPGQTVTLTVGGETFRAEVGSGLGFRTTVDAAKLLANRGYTVQAAVAGNNGAEAKTARSYGVAPEAAAKIDITGIGSGFDLGIPQAEPHVRIGGTIETGGVFAEGLNGERLRRITVTAGGKSYGAGVKADRSFFFDIPVRDLAALEGEMLAFKVDADPQLYSLKQTGANAYRINTLARYAPVEVKSVAFESPYIKQNSDGHYVVGGAQTAKTVISGKAGGSAKAGDTVVVEVGGKAYAGGVDENLAFAVGVETADLAAAGHSVRAVLHTADLSGRSITVSDTEHYAAPQRNGGAFASPHTRMAAAAVNSDHTAENHNFPYFIQKTGNLNGGSYGIDFGGKADGAAVIKYHFMTLDEIAGLPANYNRYIDRTTMTSYSSDLQDIVRQAYKQISAVANIEFVEVADMARADTNYFMGNLTDGYEGASALAYNGGLIAWNSRHNYMSWGKDFLHYTVLHEVSHTLGMGHTSIGFTGSYLPEETVEFSNMSYKAYANDNLFLNRGELRSYDLAYLHYAFGVSKTARTGDDTYTFKNYNMYSQDGDRYIWDAGGTDTFDASAEKQGVNVNLTPGSWIYTGSSLEQNFAVKSSTTHDMRSYFGLDGNAALSGRSNAKVTLNTYTEGQAFIGYGTQIENLIGSAHDDVLTGNGADNHIYGGAGNDRISGGAGNDYLDGGKGADTLAGGAGDDTYVVDDAGDTVTEAAAEGDDHVYSSIDYTLGDHLERLTLIGTTAVNGSGNSLNNTITGNGLANVLNGGAGDDRIIGGGGSDTLTGGEGRDTFVFDSALDGSVDTITDFTVGTDLIELDSAVFSGLTGNTMEEWAQYVRYHADTGRLTYSGSAKAEGIHFATLDKNLEIDHNSFTVV